MLQIALNARQKLQGVLNSKQIAAFSMQNVANCFIFKAKNLKMSKFAFRSKQHAANSKQNEAECRW